MYTHTHIYLVPFDFHPVYLRILCPRESEKAQLQTLGRAPGFRVRARMRGAGTEGDAGLQRRARVSRGRSEDRTHNCREAAPGCRTGMGTPHPVNFRRLQRKQELANQKPAGPGRCCEASLGWLAENLGARRSCPRTGWPTGARRSSYCQVKASPPPTGRRKRRHLRREQLSSLSGVKLLHPSRSKDQVRPTRSFVAAVYLMGHSRQASSICHKWLWLRVVIRTGRRIV